MLVVQVLTEQTTAITDVILACAALICAYLIWQRSPSQAQRSHWCAVFTLLALAAFEGALAHGLVLPELANKGIWAVTYLALALMVALFAVVLAIELLGEAAGRRWLIPMLSLAGMFYAYVMLFPVSFTPFIVYELCVMVSALLGYLWLYSKRRGAGYGWLAAGVAITIFAAGVQATKIGSFTLIWPFDHNGVYHLIQTLGVWVLYTGVRQTLRHNVQGNIV